MTRPLDDALIRSLAGKRLVVLANREPYSHERVNGDIVIQQPASGLVTGIEPLLVATGGVWIAHGSGSADRAVVDERSTVPVPPDEPAYSLRRIWLTEDEVSGFYEGAANEALWPLCHLAFTKPTFRPRDFETYRAVNRKFVEAAVDATRGETIVLVQDYHFALVPAMLRERGSRAPIHLFWHIPWPPAEVFQLCPWDSELLRGMLGADIVGFHSLRYCRNFVESCSRILECEADFDELTVRLDGRTTRVRRYPISIEWPMETASREEGMQVREQLGIPGHIHLSVGVDRVDHTKGLLERLAGVERFFELYPNWKRRYVFMEVASPSRMAIESYRLLNEMLVAETERINERFSEGEWKPVLLERRTLSPPELRAHYAAADSGLVTPLHDGMNLVAKEYVASCVDDRGILILSEFTGAAEELTEAILINPYDADGIAHAIHQAIVMPEREKRERMRKLRKKIAEHTIYDWAADILGDSIEIMENR
ncbi:MAG TPA: trehalose-6-phosphate synthase [Thermoanaerobaculia bacterium]|nr:trehalose-6-phosphate synthase [Thermoanaerobaculia bacterium]